VCPASAQRRGRLQLKPRRAAAKRGRNRRARDWRHVKSLCKELDMTRLPVKHQIVFAALGTLASVGTLALAVLAPLVA
jgi:hypothetical protein